MSEHRPENYWSYPHNDERANMAAVAHPVAAVLLAVGCAIVERLETIAVLLRDEEEMGGYS